MSLFYNNFQKLRQENADERAKVSEENRYTLGRMIDYLSSFKMSYFDLEILKKDLIGIAKEADIMQVNMEDTLGLPEKKFCENLLHESTPHTLWETLLPAIRNFFLGLWVCYTVPFILFGFPSCYRLSFSSILIDVVIALSLSFYAIDELDVFRKKVTKTHKVTQMRFIGTVLTLFMVVLLLFTEGHMFALNGRMIFIILLFLSFLFFFVNNYYWDLRSKSYHWE